MKLTLKSTRLTYKTMFGYSLAIIALLLIAVPVLAATRPEVNFLDFSLSAKTGGSPQEARDITKGINVDNLAPGEVSWYVYNKDSFDAPSLSWISLAMRYETEAIISPEQANFEVILAKNGGSNWFSQQANPDELLGTGLRSPLKTTAKNLVESFWTGSVTENNLYYVRVFNNSPFNLNYSLEAKGEEAIFSGATPASLNSASSNRQIAWTLTAQAVENMPAKQAAIWMRQAQKAGWLVTADSSANFRPDPSKTDPQILWDLTAQAIEGQDADTAARWLIQADSMGWLSIPLSSTLKNPNPAPPKANSDGKGDGDAKKSTQIPTPDNSYQGINIYPNNPLYFDFNNVNSGRLQPYGEHWYSIVLANMDKKLIEDMALTMFFTPRKGYISDRVNFEIFPASQYHIWTRGDSNYMEHIGTGMWVSRDKDPDTGERLWSGSLVDGDRYFIKVNNGSPDIVDYYLFNGDVENAELGNPIFHKGSSSNDRLSRAASPPTKAKPF